MKLKAVYLPSNLANAVELFAAGFEPYAKAGGGTAFLADLVAGCLWDFYYVGYADLPAYLRDAANGASLSRRVKSVLPEAGEYARMIQAGAYSRIVSQRMEDCGMAAKGGRA